MKFTPRYTEKDRARWRRMRDVVAGEEAVKDADRAFVKARRTSVSGGRQMAAHRYLPRPNPLDLSSENDARYLHYIDRAHFFGVTGRTVSGLVGMATKNPATVQIPERISGMIQNVDGAGLTLDGMAQALVREGLTTGRAGLFVDFPSNPGLEALPTLTVFNAEDVLSWHSTWADGSERLEFVLLRETVTEADGFEIEEVEQVLALSLDDDVYTLTRYRKNGETFDEVENSRVQPTGQDGRTLDRIPFVFLGAVCNDPAIDLPPILDLADTNIAHYRNSADFEESAFLLGQPWPVFSNLSRSTIERFENSGIVFGSRGPALLGEGETAELLQVDPNTLAQEAMRQKEAQMVKLGAQLMEPSVVMTAEQSRNESNATYSQLSLVVRNVSAAITTALNLALSFVRANESASYDLDADFTSLQIDGNTLRAIVEGWQSAAYPKQVMRSMLRKIGGTRLTDEDLDDLEGREIL